jgi:hypothetical protein
MISEISKECSAVMFRVSQSKKNDCLQEHYIGMDIEDDDEPPGGSTAEAVGVLTEIFCSSHWIAGMELKLYSRVFYK